MLAACLLFPYQAPAQAPPATAAASALDTEIVVTARKIEERVHDVPMSVQVLPGDYLNDAGVVRLFELQYAVPGLVINTTGMHGAGFSLRGIADQRIAELSIAPHLNGVYLGDANVAVARMFDVERVEVLKGPQGTLYGRNATGGSINVITRTPQDTQDSEIEISYGSFRTAGARGHVNLPLSSGGFRLAFTAADGDGYIRNSVDGRRFGEDDHWGLRVALRIEPSHTLRLDLMAQHLQDDGGRAELWTPRPDFLPDPRDIRLTSVTHADPFLVSEIDNLNLSLEFGLGPATLRSISGYAHSELRNVDDCAGIPVLRDCVRSNLPNEFEILSQELQLVLPGSGALEGIIGAYYSQSDKSQAVYQVLPFLNPRPTNDNRTTASDTAYALFGQATASFGNGWNATGGLRLSREEHRGTTVGTGFQDSPTLLVGTIDSDNLSWLLSLSRALGADLMLYGSVSTGYKNGGPLAGRLPTNEADTYGPEQLTAFELGAKSRRLDGRLTLNAAAFFYDYEDLQVGTITLVGNSFINNIDNAARAELYGIDAEFDFAVTERWSISGGVVWLPKREYVEYRNEVTGDTLSGNELVRAPEWSAVGAVAYERPWRERGSLSARLEYSYRSDHFFTPENDSGFYQDGFGLLNAHLRFEAASGAWYLFASGRNLTDQDYFNHVFFQSSPGYPDTYEVGIGIRF